MNVKQALCAIGSMGKAQKMPETSYGLSAFRCEVGSKLAEQPGSV